MLLGKTSIRRPPLLRNPHGVSPQFYQHHSPPPLLLPPLSPLLPTAADLADATNTTNASTDLPERTLMLLPTEDGMVWALEHSGKNPCLVSDLDFLSPFLCAPPHPCSFTFEQ